MSANLPPDAQIVGIQPWLPWPLSAWSWWTTPVRAERLALLRIGVGLVLLLDVLCLYAPDTLDYFASGRLADGPIFNYRFDSPRATWSLLRGVGDGVTQYISIFLCILTTLWIAGNSFARLLLVHKNPPVNDRTGVAVWIWTLSFGWYVASLWSQLVHGPNAAAFDALAWVVPLAGVSLTCLFLTLDLATRLRDPEHRIKWVPLILAFAFANVLLCAGLLLAVHFKTIDPKSWFGIALAPWQNNDDLVLAVMVIWIASAAFLLIGCCTRVAAVTAWLTSMSFANANMRLDNAGDTIRLILLFYLMLCPCGAAWSIDALFKRRSAADETSVARGPVYVHPWPICLIFVQMIFMYWMNGIYKLFGETWREGSSLHFVLGDLALARFSTVALPLPFWMTRIMSWSVLSWEVLFPFLVIFKWPRRLALALGVMFHLGIMASMELGPFVPYALCMYLPLIPLEWLGRSRDSGQVAAPDQAPAR